MKIAVYTIALNEEQFVQRWADSCKEADYRVIIDTGSTDGTVKAAKKLGITTEKISVKPWRFDDARNASLALLPDDADICVSLDMDEYLLPGWREEIEKAFAQGATRIRYNYTWNFNPDGTPGLTFGGDKIHARHGYRWKHPVHETLFTDRIEEKQVWTQLEMHHKADNTKPRSQYLPLLAQSVKEDPYDDRNAYYYARELYFYGMYDLAALEFERHLELERAVWPPERAASMRYLAKCRPNDAIKWLNKAIQQSPDRREPHVELAQLAYNKQDWSSCYNHALDALKIAEKPLDYLCEEFAWNWLPYDLAAISAHNLGYRKEALAYGEKALELSTDLERDRLDMNIKYYKEAINDQ